MELYRFRSDPKYIIDELQKNYLYFALPNELNDPMEGFLNIYWEGDVVLWRNFIKHYLYTLTRSVIRATIDPKTIKEPLSICSEYSNPELRSLFEKIRNNFFDDKGIKAFVDYLTTLKHRIFIKEIENYLSLIHFVALSVIIDVLKEKQLVNWSVPKLEVLGFFNKMKFLMPSLEEQYPDAINVFFIASQKVKEDLNLLQKVNIEDVNDIKSFFLMDFPSKYIKEVRKILFFTPCFVCFMEDFSSPSLWGYYGGKHKGLCLIFDDKKGQNEVKFKFTSGGVISITTQKIKYQKEYKKINFFEMMGSLPLSVIEKSWLIDWEGNKTSFLKIGDNFLTDKWRKDYNKNLSEVFATKIPDWEKEKEHRIVLQKEFVAGDSVESRKFVYDFELLKGIIFGLNAEDSFKVEVIQIITKKCKELGRKDFKFYQAEYNEETGLIDKIEIRL